MSKTEAGEISIDESLTGITQGAIKRLANSAGSESIGKGVVLCVRDSIKSHLEKVLYKAFEYTKADSRATLKGTDVISALDCMGVSVLSGISAPRKKTISVEDNTSRDVTVRDVFDIKACKVKKRTTRTGKRKSKKGAFDTQAVKYYQKQHDCLFFPKEAFRRVVRTIIKSFMDEPFRIAEDAQLIMQKNVEYTIRKLLSVANDIAHNHSRKRVKNEDFMFACEMQKIFSCN